MASIVKRGKKWLVRWYDPDGERRTQTCPDKRTADELARAVERARALGRRWEPEEVRAPARPDLSLAAVGQAYLRSQGIRLRKTTLERYAVGLDLLQRFMDSRGDKDLTVLSRSFIEAGVAWLNAGEDGRTRKIATSHKTARIWLGFWSWAADREEYEAFLPRFRTMPISVPAPPPPRTPTEIDCAGFIGNLPDIEGLRRMVLLAWYTGARHNEIRLLTWDEVNLGAETITIRPERSKGGYGGRVIPMHPGLVEAVRGWDRDQPLLHELPGRCYTSVLVRRAWEQAGTHPEVYERHGLHIFRTLMRTRLVVADIHPDVINALLGHTGGSVGERHYTDRARLLPQLRKAVALIPLCPPWQGTGPRRWAKRFNPVGSQWDQPRGLSPKMPVESRAKNGRGDNDTNADATDGTPESAADAANRRA